MISALVDNLIGVLSPATALKRMQARNVLSHLARGYDGAKNDRLHSNWQALNRSADLELQSDADAIRARARDLVRNNAYAYGALRAIVRNVVGCGIKPQARVKRPRGQQNERFNTAAETLFQQWQASCDVGGRLTFYELQVLALSEVIEAGEVLVHFVQDASDRSRPIPLALELVEADRLAGDVFFPRGINADTGNEVRRGIEIDGAGRAVAYWLYPTHPNDVNVLHVRPERWPADNFIHLYRVKRPGQTRGVSDFAPTIRRFRDIDYYLDNELQAAAVSSCFTAAVKTLAGPADGGLLDTIDDDATDDDANTFEYLQPGMVARLMPGEDVSIINPARGHSEAAVFVQFMLRSLAVGLGLSYERLVRDYSQTNFSSNRASDLEDRREFRPLQQWLIEHLCVPVWNRVVAAAVMADTSEFPDAFDFLGNFRRWTDHVWNPPGWEWVDPKNQAVASETALNANMTTLSDELGAQGKDWRSVLEQRAIEKELQDELGLTAQPPAMEETDVEETEIEEAVA